MPKILIKTGENKGKIYRFKREAVTIGRDASQTITLPDKRVSRNHAVIIFKDGKYIIKDNHSTNGTMVNGAFTTEEFLEFGNEIKIGHSILSFLSLSAPERLTEEIPQIKFLPEGTGLSGMTMEMVIPPRETKAPDLMELNKANQRLDILYWISQDISSFLELPKILSRIIELSLRVINAERGIIMLIDKESGELVTQAVREGKQPKEFVVSRTIINEVLKSGKSIFTADATKDTRFKDAESVAMQRLRSAMCVPIRSKNSIIGIMYVDSHLKVRGFPKGDLELLTAICNQVGVAIENAKLVSDLKRANKELKEKQTELIEAEKMSALGHLAGGIVHEVKNPLTGIVGYTQMLIRDLKRGKKDLKSIEKNINIIEKQGQRCMGLLRNLLEFSHRKTPGMRPVDINQVVEEALVILKYYMQPKDAMIKIIKRLDPNLPQINADPDQIQQVFLNLYMNAKDAMSKGGTLTIVTRKSEEALLIDFIDTGPGIPEDIRGEIFKPLFTTKGEGKGTGLGLSVSKEIIERHNGVIEFNSQMEKGTTFTVHLPLKPQ